MRGGTPGAPPRRAPGAREAAALELPDGRFDRAQPRGLRDLTSSYRYVDLSSPQVEECVGTEQSQLGMAPWSSP